MADILTQMCYAVASVNVLQRISYHSDGADGEPVRKRLVRREPPDGRGSSMGREIGTSSSASDAYLAGGYMIVRPAERAA